MEPLKVRQRRQALLEALGQLRYDLAAHRAALRAAWQPPLENMTNRQVVFSRLRSQGEVLQQRLFALRGEFAAIEAEERAARENGSGAGPLDVE